MVFGIGAGGLAVAAEVARQLTARLDLLLVQRLVLPCDERTVLGAIAEGGACVLNDALVDALDIESDAIGALRASAEAELLARNRELRDARPRLAVRERTVVVVEEVLANPMPLHAALLSLHQHSPRAVIVAAPLALERVVRDLRALASEVVALEIEEAIADDVCLFEVGASPSDADVRRMLGLSGEAPHPVFRSGATDEQ